MIWCNESQDSEGIVLVVLAYYSGEIRSKISKGSKCVGQCPEETKNTLSFTVGLHRTLSVSEFRCVCRAVCQPHSPGPQTPGFLLGGGPVGM